MSKYLEEAKRVRAITDVHYNCGQGVLVPFAEDAGVQPELAYKIGANFGSGLKRGATCGAIAGGLVVLGLYGVDDPQTVGLYYQKLREKHNGELTCRELLKSMAERGENKKNHCDGMVFECVELAEEILKEKGII